jgi:hypothetical protein
VGGLVTAALFYFGGLSEELTAIGLGLLAATIITIGKLAWHASQAKVVQLSKSHADLLTAHEAATIRLDELESRRPRIGAIRVDFDGLAILNDGASAKFSAQIRILDRRSWLRADPSRRYQGFWESPERGSAFIHTGHEARLILGGPRPHSLPGHPAAKFGSRLL